jgi:hypothetical protein
MELVRVFSTDFPCGIQNAFNDIPASLEKIPWAAPVNLADILLELEKGTDFHRPAMSIYSLGVSGYTSRLSVSRVVTSAVEGVFQVAVVRDS